VVCGLVFPIPTLPSLVILILSSDEPLPDGVVKSLRLEGILFKLGVAPTSTFDSIAAPPKNCVPSYPPKVIKPRLSFPEQTKGDACVPLALYKLR